MPGKPTGADTIWGGKGTPEPAQPRWASVAWWTLLALGILALGALGTTAWRYNNALVLTRGLAVEIIDLQVVSDENPSVVVHFRLQNNAAQALSLDSYQFELSMNGEYMGHTLAAYKGQDPAAGAASYARDARIDGALAPRAVLERNFTLFVAPQTLETIRQAQEAGSPTWQATVAVYAHLPGLRPLRTIALNAQWPE
jgi:hypothetical protein